MCKLLSCSHNDFTYELECGHLSQHYMPHPCQHAAYLQWTLTIDKTGCVRERRAAVTGDVLRPRLRVQGRLAAGHVAGARPSVTPPAVPPITASDDTGRAVMQDIVQCKSMCISQGCAASLWDREKPEGNHTMEMLRRKVFCIGLYSSFSWCVRGPEPGSMPCSCRALR